MYSRERRVSPQTVQQNQSNDDSFDMAPAMAALKIGDPVLRAGGSALLEYRRSDALENDRRAFFEAGIVAYAKCFNSNLRTRLSEAIFRGPLHAQKPLHVWIMEVRNEQAHCSF